MLLDQNHLFRVHAKPKSKSVLMRASPADCVAAQNIYFHLNHPIQYVYLCGPVAGIEVFSNKAGSRKFISLTLDDSSGRTIEILVEVKLPSRPSTKANPKLEPQHSHGAPHRWITNNYVKLKRKPNEETQESDSSSDESAEQGHNKTAPVDTHIFKLTDPSIQRTPVIQTTDATDVTLTSACENERCHSEHVVIDNQIIDVNTVLKVKGTLRKWNDAFQLRPKRISIVRGSEEEARIWSEYAGFCDEVLAKPWRLSDEQVAALEAGEKKTTRAEIDKEKKLEEREIQRELYRKKIAAAEVKAEAKRQAMVSELNGNALDRPDWKPSKKRRRSKKVRV